MDPYPPSTTSIATVCPATSSPSNLSYSPGLSHVSTRSTSPDSPSMGALPRSSSPLIDLDVATVTQENTLNIRLDRPTSTDMDKNPFQSVNDRRNKFTSERLTRNPFQDGQQQQQQQLTSPQPPVTRLVVQALPGNHRNLASANWRAHATEDVIIPQPRTVCNAFDYFTHHSQHVPVRSVPLPGHRKDQHQHPRHSDNGVPYQGYGPISDAQLDSSFAYCFDRGNGKYTRLVPADMLPAFLGIPAIQQSCGGMVVVPQPRGLPPNGYSSSIELAALRNFPAAASSPPDTIQSRIDNIVAATPSPPAHLPAPTGVGPSPSHNTPPSHRRPKIYCDKWVHEGTCAFTQQGCKYKHEMPSDKVTQHQLGLFHGYPQWWKKQQADQARVRETPPPESPQSCVQADGPRLNGDRYPIRPIDLSVGNGGARVGGLSWALDTGGRHAWRHGGEHCSDPHVLGSPSPIARVPASWGIVGGVRNPLAASPLDKNQQTGLVSYGSRFGPIAPPARSTAVAAVSTEPLCGPPVIPPSAQSHAITDSARKSSPAGAHMAASSVPPTSNPFAALEVLDGNSDHQNTNGGDAYS
ncbi:hypothetical protein F4802DRAFT_131438 [Xylaria palmicola]|nr:hypothetical protein F4802DRAFT_131438 [Xylaria palmicola]